MDYILKQSSALFEPEEQLSLDETLIRTFGRIKKKQIQSSSLGWMGIKETCFLHSAVVKIH
jgi:hypothetical protein